ncbi:flagellar basal body-associated FliL family protein [Sinisalibacter aestuarii]|uniref:Flagellar protein FliL n=1 Tax=Sinisalibacter aestuarii TaxID=2949426 RepID=A0ABQ5LNT8_9RHOB|nr:flagellar basal body-associated FliL family protein [Sinisalibacter aestuarii]GKY86675.1 flagellar basal body protein FliL [Sinisalibacter aestuarii]
MADVEEPDGGADEAAPKKAGRKGLVIGLVLALLLGGGGFYAVYSGMILGQREAALPDAGAHDDTAETLPPVAFVPLEPLVISLGTGTRSRHLRFRAELEVAPEAQADVTKLTPRVMDVLNSYLRAVELSDLENASSLIGLRAQMLRRIQLVTGEGRVRDLLIMEFVLS